MPTPPKLPPPLQTETVCPAQPQITKRTQAPPGETAVCQTNLEFHAAAAKDDNEYRRRSPVTYASKLEKPLLIHGNTNDETVRIIEVQRLIDALTAAGRIFEYKIYDAAPGGHHFNRIDTKLARESRAEIYNFLNKHLRPLDEVGKP